MQVHLVSMLIVISIIIVKKIFIFISEIYHKVKLIKLNYTSKIYFRILELPIVTFNYN